MKKIFSLSAIILVLIGCGKNEDKMIENNNTSEPDNFVYQTEQFADLAVLRYKVPGFEELSLKEK